MTDVINSNSFSPGQQDQIERALQVFMGALVQTAPILAPHFLSGGMINIQTMSGANLRFGFKPQPGGLILPGGIRPAGQNGSLIK